ncbi:MAG: anti-sigma regulatory factor [Syntrophus sp. (in: bacteria)]|nr:anti-sigma regulatory factor [Syntrophus sp. (in: bacteria)]
MHFKVEEEDFIIAGEAASKTKKALQQLGLKQEIVKNIAIIVYEAAMNIVIHANYGEVQVIIVPAYVTVIAQDKGGGIPDVDLAMQEGYSTAPIEAQEMGFGAGMGLPNMKKCSDIMHIETQVGVGTTLKATIYLHQSDAKQVETGAMYV